jgi:hypothetical protein
MKVEELNSDELVRRLLKHGSSVRAHGVLCIDLGIDSERAAYAEVHKELMRRLDEYSRLVEVEQTALNVLDDKDEHPERTGKTAVLLLKTMVDTLSDLVRQHDMPEPGQLIAIVHCPCCGAKLKIQHGDDEGEIGALTEGGCP